MTIQTSYIREGAAISISGYGKGTTPEDIAGGKVTPRSTSVGFHEGSHGLNFIEFLETHPPPEFTGTVGMAVPQFKQAMTAWNHQIRAYWPKIREFSSKETDCVGNTIDEYYLAGKETGPAYTLVCAT